MYELMIEETFDSAHALRGYSGPCESLHGHTFKVQAFFEGDKLDNIGLLVDFKILKNKVSAILAEFDHIFLNDLAEFKSVNPSSENIARIIYGKIKNQFSLLSKVTVWESQTASATYRE